MLLLPVFRGLLHVESVEEIRTDLKKEFARIIAVESRESPEQIDTAIAVAAEMASLACLGDYLPVTNGLKARPWPTWRRWPSHSRPMRTTFTWR